MGGAAVARSIRASGAGRSVAWYHPARPWASYAARPRLRNRVSSQRNPLGSCFRLYHLLWGSFQC